MPGASTNHAEVLGSPAGIPTTGLLNPAINQWGQPPHFGTGMAQPAMVPQTVPLYQATGNYGPNIAFSHAPLDAAVYPKIKNSIWANEFVEFAQLVNKAGDDMVAIVLGGDTEAIRLQSKKNKTLSFNEWLKAFFIYTSVYVQR